MLPVSAMSDAANKLRDVLVDQIDDLDAANRIRIGHPNDTIEGMMGEGLNSLNLFFYNVSYDGYPADGLSEDPFYVRLHWDDHFRSMWHQLRVMKNITAKQTSDRVCRGILSVRCCCGVTKEVRVFFVSSLRRKKEQPQQMTIIFS